MQPAPTPAVARRVLARKDPAFRVALRSLPEEAQTKLQDAGLLEPALWDVMVDFEGPDPVVEVESTLQVLCGPLEIGLGRSLVRTFLC